MADADAARGRLDHVEGGCGGGTGGGVGSFKRQSRAVAGGYGIHEGKLLLSPYAYAAYLLLLLLVLNRSNGRPVQGQRGRCRRRN